MGTEQATYLKGTRWSSSHPIVQNEVKQGLVKGTSLIGWDTKRKGRWCFAHSSFVYLCPLWEFNCFFNPDCDKSRVFVWTHTMKEHNPHSALGDFLFPLLFHQSCLWELPPSPHPTLHKEGLGARPEVLSHLFCCELCQYTLLITRLKIACLESPYGYHGGKLETLIGLTWTRRKRAKGMVGEEGSCGWMLDFEAGGDVFWDGNTTHPPNAAARKSQTAWNLPE